MHCIDLECTNLLRTCKLKVHVSKIQWIFVVRQNRMNLPHAKKTDSTHQWNCPTQNISATILH